MSRAEKSDDEQNPHVWYDPAAVTAVADAVTAELGKLAPEAADYFAPAPQRVHRPDEAIRRTISAIKTGAAGKTYAATESVFDDMAAAVGLQNRDTAGLPGRLRNETDPSPADLDAFHSC